MRHLAIDLFCGLGGWAEGLLAVGWRVIGFDIERHQYMAPDPMTVKDGGGKGTRPLEKRGWTQGCAVSLGLEGANKRPLTRLIQYPAELVIQDVLTLHGSQFAGADLIVASPPCQEYSYMAMPWSRAKQIRRALLGDGEFPEPYTGSRTIPELRALFDACFRIQREASEAAGRHIPMIVENVKGAQAWVGRAKANYGSFYLWGDVGMVNGKLAAGGIAFGTELLSPVRLRKSKHIPLVDTPNGTGKTSWFFGNSKHEGRFYGVKVPNLPAGDGWFGANNKHSLSQHSSRSQARKQASAEIAKIPFPLAKWIGEVYR